MSRFVFGSNLFPSPLGRGVQGRGLDACGPHPDPLPAGEGDGTPWRYARCPTPNNPAIWKGLAQLAVVLLCAFALKLYYSNASVNELRWILAPTTALVELISGGSFAFESHAGYLSGDRTFLIAASCAGVNFLITSFLMLALMKLWRDRSRPSPNLAWSFIPIAALFAYVATLVANTARISIALWLRRMPLENGWLSANQLHRLEGIFVYFGFLLLLFLVTERLSSRSVLSPASLANVATLSPHASGARREPSHFRRSLFPLFIYYLTALGIPLANSLYHRRIAATDFWEHSLFVFLTPLLLVLILAALHFYKSRRGLPNSKSATTNRTHLGRPWPAAFLSNRFTQTRS